jgi:hypothetical protein
MEGEPPASPSIVYLRNANGRMYMSGLRACLRKLARRKQWLIATGVLVLAFTGIGALSVGSDDTAPAATTAIAKAAIDDTFTPPPQPKRPKPKPQPQPKPLDSPQQARYLHFQDPRFTAKFMAKYLNGGSAFDDVFYGVATPFEITLHGNLHGSRFDLRLYKVGPQRVLLKNCMMGSCYSDWAGARVGQQPAQRSARFLLHQRVRAGVLRLASRSGD